LLKWTTSAQIYENQMLPNLPNMKVAVCVAGQPREYKEGFKDIKKCIVDYNPNAEFDFFLHAWQGKDGEEYDSSSWAKGTVGSQHPATTQDLFNLYNPKTFLIQNQLEFELPREYTRTAMQGQHIPYSMFYSVMRADYLRREHEAHYNFTYDWVFRMRYDLYLNSKIKLMDLDPDFVYLPDNIQITSGRTHCFNDMFAFSSSKNMSVYGNTYNNIDKLYTERNITYVQEEIIGAQLLANNVKIMPCAFNAGLYRTTHNHFIREQNERDVFILSEDVYKL
jgi:hypothetical protein